MAELMETYFARVGPSTRRGYAADLECLALFLGLPDGSAAIDHLLLAGPAQANLVALRFLAAREAAGDKPGTRRRRLAAIRSALGVARLFGMISWHIEVSGPRASAYRDTRGPGLDGVRALLGAIRGQSPKATRDRAIVRLMFDTGLRRGEVVGLDVEHLDLAGSRVSILGKARDEREWVTLPDPTKRAVAAWLAHRGLDAGPLFVELARNGTRGRLSGRSVHRVITRLGVKAGLGVVRPHGLRHTAITALLDHHDVRRVQRFSRHRSIQILTVYDDNREDVGGALARELAGGMDD